MDGWFTEKDALWSGQRFSLQVDEELFTEKSEYQDVVVLQSSSYGKVLVLDGVIQATERDEFAYHEMIAHVPITIHPAPKRVLIIGGGDGGAVREVARHADVQEIVLCELDPAVCDVSKRFFKETLARGFFDDPRVTTVHQDGYQYTRDTKDKFDIIIVDSSDPIGPAESLFKASFFEVCRRALHPDNGILCMQGESIWLHLDLIDGVLSSCGDVGFPSIDYYMTTVPSYPGGTIGMVICSNDPYQRFQEPLRHMETLRYYNEQIHKSSFSLPQFAEDVVSNRRRSFKKRTNRSNECA